MKPNEVIARAIADDCGEEKDWRVYEGLASIITDALRAAGLRIVSEEPTEAMLDAIAGTSFANLPSIKQRAERNAYRAMLDAAGGSDE